MTRTLATAFLLVALVPAARAAEPQATLLEHTGRWESGYGSTFYNVVGRVKSTAPQPISYVKLRIELLDGQAKPVASAEAYTENAEALADPALDEAGRTKALETIEPIAPGAEKRFRASFLKEETPPFVAHRVVIVATPTRTPE